ncbi:uncharacterized protein [Palaemon carinicauda]|uniref:uncharacterized protein n=1 Tax=Palaemon carinicauda TaxID=392227 RepID=UPI0035B5D05F
MMYPIEPINLEEEEEEEEEERKSNDKADIDNDDGDDDDEEEEEDEERKSNDKADIDNDDGDDDDEEEGDYKTIAPILVKKTVVTSKNEEKYEDLEEEEEEEEEEERKSNDKADIDNDDVDDDDEEEEEEEETINMHEKFLKMKHLFFDIFNFTSKRCFIGHECSLNIEIYNLEDYVKKNKKKDIVLASQIRDANREHKFLIQYNCQRRRTTNYADVNTNKQTTKHDEI